jgi:hypothetical protein
VKTFLAWTSNTRGGNTQVKSERSKRQGAQASGSNIEVDLSETRFAGVSSSVLLQAAVQRVMEESEGKLASKGFDETKKKLEKKIRELEDSMEKMKKMVREEKRARQDLSDQVRVLERREKGRRMGMTLDVSSSKEASGRSEEEGPARKKARREGL